MTETAEAGPASVVRHVLIALASWAAFAAAHPPVAFAPLAFVALVPWLIALRVLPERGMGRGFMAGTTFYGVCQLAWVAAEPMGWGGKVIFCLLMTTWFLAHLPMVAILRRGCGRRRWPMWLVIPLTITAHDVFLEWFVGGVAWQSIGYAFVDWTPFVQVAEIGRVWPLTLLAWFVNVALADVVLAWRWNIGARRSAMIRLASAVVVAIVFLVYGHFRMRSIETRLEPGPNLLGLQINMAQGEKLRRRRAVAFTKLGRLLEEGLPRDEAVDLVVCPETMFAVDDSTRGRRRRAASTQDFLNGPAGPLGRPLAVDLAMLLARSGVDETHRPRFVIGFVRHDDMPEGGYDEEGQGLRQRNSALVVEHETHRRLRVVTAYDKRELVPGGEYLPFRAFTWGREALKRRIRESVGFLPTMSVGEGPVLFDAWRRDDDSERPSARAAFSICFEIVFPNLYREDRRAGADFFLNVSNDAWYRGSAQQRLVHVQTKFRAIENRASMFRVSNTGISALIDPLGREVDVAAQDGRRVDVDGFVRGRVPVGAGPSFFARCGNVVGYGIVLAALTVLSGLVLKRRR